MDIPQIFYFLLGTAVGSFLNAWSRRLLRGQFPTGRSHCEHCRHILGFFDLIPLLSFIALRGRCRYCHKPLSWQYPTVEFATGLLFVEFSLITDGDLRLTVPLLIASSALITIFITDFSAQIIFDQVLWVAGGGALMYRLLATSNSRLAYDLMGAFGVFFFLQAIRGITRKRGLGEGDPPLGFITALLVGFPLALVELFLAFVGGGATGAGLVLLGKKKLKDRVAFGPFLVAAAFATILLGERIWTWYLGVLGL
uniref:Prepilin peptidase n=1 Tax=candidate division WWE3 bacterium TaxID=2053526 RepID=A0A831YQ44_UNCKA